MSQLSQPQITLPVTAPLEYRSINIPVCLNCVAPGPLSVA